MEIFTKLLDIVKSKLVKNFLIKEKEVKPVVLEEFNNSRIVGEAGAGLVKVILSGLGEPIAVEIDDLVFKETEKQLVSDLFVAALKNANEKIVANITKYREMMIQKQNPTYNEQYNR